MLCGILYYYSMRVRQEYILLVYVYKCILMCGMLHSVRVRISSESTSKMISPSYYVDLVAVQVLSCSLICEWVGYSSVVVSLTKQASKLSTSTNKGAKLSPEWPLCSGHYYAPDSLLHYYVYCLLGLVTDNY